MSAAPVFVSRLVGLPLLGSNGIAIGRVDDVVVGYPGPDSPPPVMGFVAEIQRRHIFVNANRVSDLGAEGARLFSTTVDFRPFRLRSGEMLVRRGLFDRRVGREVINDVALRPTPGSVRTWEVAGASLVATGLLRRRRT